MKTIIIYHNADLDGKASAVILKNRYTDAELIGYNYGDFFDTDTVQDAKVIMADVSMSYEDMKAIKEKASQFIWIDHHKSAIEEMIDLDLQGIQEVGRAACVLCWEYCFPKQTIPMGIWLLGKYDIWDHADERVLPFQYGARLHLHEIEENHTWFLLLQNDKPIFDKILKDGNAIWQYVIEDHQNYIAYYGSQAYLPVGDKTYFCLVINRGAFASPVLDKFYEDYDLVLSFAMTATGKWQYRITSKKYDCSAIAKTFGGGGHAGAAGFTANTIVFEFENEVPMPENTHLQPKIHFPASADAELIEWTNWAVKRAIPIQFKDMEEPFSVETKEGIMYGKPGDKLMLGVFGELYPCDKQIFEGTYDVVTEEELLNRNVEMENQPQTNRQKLEASLPEAMRVPKQEPVEGNKSNSPLPVIKYIAISFTLKGQPWSLIKDALVKIAKENEGILIHGFLPREEVIKRGFPLDVTETLEAFFPAQLNFWKEGPAEDWRADMAMFVKDHNANVYVIGEIKEGVKDEIEAYTLLDVVKIHQYTFTEEEIAIALNENPKPLTEKEKEQANAQISDNNEKKHAGQPSSSTPKSDVSKPVDGETKKGSGKAGTGKKKKKKKAGESSGKKTTDTKAK